MMTFCLQKRIIYVCMDFQQKLTYPMRTGYPLLHFSVTRSCLEFPYVLVQASDLSREKGNTFSQLHMNIISGCQISLCVFCWGFPRWWERKNLYTEKTICVFPFSNITFCVHLTCFSLSYVSSLSVCNTKCTGSIGYVYSFDCAYFPLLIVSFRNISPKFWVCVH